MKQTENQKKYWKKELKKCNSMIRKAKEEQEKFLKRAIKAKCKFNHPKDIPLMIFGMYE